MASESLGELRMTAATILTITALIECAIYVRARLS